MMLGDFLDTKVLYWILAGVFGAILAFAGDELSINIIRWISKRGRPPNKRPAYLWVIFYFSLAASVFFGALAAFSSPRAEVTNNLEYTGSVVNISNEPVQGAKITLYSNNTTQVDFTDSEGMYRFEIPVDSPLNGQIDRSAEGYQPSREELNLDPEVGTPARITLVPNITITNEGGATNGKTEESPPPLATDSSNWATISCDVPQVSLRMSPGYIEKDDFDVIVKIDCGQKVELFGESQDADSLTWWMVSWNGYSGWMADHTGSGKVILIFNQ
jgi:hypothetical protein